MKKIISFTVNGAKQELYLDTRKTLLKMLREDLELMGVHLGCGGGDCGACTVLLNGEPVTSCLVLAVDCEGAEITTVEGVQQNGELHPLQQSMIEKGGIQCGFCTPGMVMNSLALLRENLSRLRPKSARHFPEIFVAVPDTPKSWRRFWMQVKL